MYLCPTYVVDNIINNSIKIIYAYQSFISHVVSLTATTSTVQLAMQGLSTIAGGYLCRASVACAPALTCPKERHLYVSIIAYSFFSHAYAIVSPPSLWPCWTSTRLLLCLQCLLCRLVCFSVYHLSKNCIAFTEPSPLMALDITDLARLKCGNCKMATERYTLYDGLPTFSLQMRKVRLWFCK